MNFYKRFPGDIQRKTSHLTPAEMGIYDRLMDWYYSNERPLPVEPHRSWSIAGAVMPDDQAAVARVLEEFFVYTAGGWVDAEAERAIAESKTGGYMRWFSKLPRAVRTAMEAARRARLRSAEPRWLTPAQHEEIKELYVEARQLTLTTGEPHEVDHIVPLNGETVCGLHVPWNLRVLKAEANRLKGNLLMEDGA